MEVAEVVPGVADMAVVVEVAMGEAMGEDTVRLSCGPCAVRSVDLFIQVAAAAADIHDRAEVR